MSGDQQSKVLSTGVASAVGLTSPGEVPPHLVSHDAVKLGHIEWLDIREVWKDEATGFTPWLLENAEALGAALGIELTLERAEHAVGGFWLDLIGRDVTNDARLIVENQIEQSDHGHLGQLLTYAAGTDAATIIWIARSFRDEHRVALDWLNEQTPAEIRFFGVAVKALRVPDPQASTEQLPAPFFELAAKPNDWQLSVRKTASSQESAEATLYRLFWRPLRDEFEREWPELVAERAEPKSIWLTINSPIPKTSIGAVIGAGELRVYMEIDTGDREANLAILASLESHRHILETALGELEFDTGGQRCKIISRRPWRRKLIEQEDRYDEARAYFRRTLLEYKRVFDKVAPLI